MNLAATISLYGGGPGSGCNPEVGKCGRPSLGNWDQKGSTKAFHSDENGHYTPERTKLHDQLLIKYQHRPVQKNPVITVLLGGSASGKSTYDEKESAKLRSPTIVDVDKMRADLPEFEGVAGTPGTELLLDEARDVRTQVMMSALGHNNDIALEGVGHVDTPHQIDDIEKAGYKVKMVYVHRPVEESITLANKRADSSPTMSGRIRPPESVIRDNHKDSRSILGELMTPDREVTIYDGSGKNDAAIERMRTSEEPEIPKNLF